MKHPIAGVSHYRARPRLTLTVLEALGICTATAIAALLIQLVLS